MQEAIHAVDVAEIYSPPRIADMANRMNMKGGWSLDLTTEDENGKPYINPELSPNVTGVLGKEIRLACHVEDLGNKTVS